MGKLDPAICDDLLMCHRRRHFSLRVSLGRSTSCAYGANHRNSGVNHGTFLHIAHEEGLIRNTSIHAGIRAPVVRKKGDVRNDIRCGFEMVKARDIDRIGVSGIIEKLKSRVGDSKVYISVDIDVLDPAFAPGRFWPEYATTRHDGCCVTIRQHLELQCHFQQSSIGTV